MGPVLSEKRDTFLTKSVVASPDKFDSVYDSGMKDYLNSGGQAIIDERKAAYEKVYK
jgi:putative aldouronate transport system substrate-binding protein